MSVVLRDRMSISPDCRAVNRSFAIQGRVLDLGSITEHGGGHGPAHVDVEAGPLVLVVDRGKARETRDVDAALHEALRLDRVKVGPASAEAAPSATSAQAPSKLERRIIRGPPKFICSAIGVHRRQCIATLASGHTHDTQT